MRDDLMVQQQVKSKMATHGWRDMFKSNIQKASKTSIESERTKKISSSKIYSRVETQERRIKTAWYVESKSKKIKRHECDFLS